MILLSQNSVNEIAIIVNDIKTVDSPIYLFRFKNKQVETDEYFVELTDTIARNDAGSIFELDLPNDLDLPTGIYIMWVYQSETPGSEDWENMLELTCDRADVVPTIEEPTDYEPEGTDTVYQPEP